jgi:micrococcal nuclease
MTRFAVLLLCACFALAPSAIAGDRPDSAFGTVSWVYDGDTLEIDPFGKVRLVGIDTPEQKSSMRDRYLTRQGVPEKRLRAIYRVARQYTIRSAKGQRVTLTFDRERRDRYGRLLAYLTLPNGQLLNRQLLKRGLAVVYRRFDFRLKADFLTAERAARDAQRGLWGDAYTPGTGKGR